MLDRREIEGKASQPYFENKSNLGVFKINFKLTEEEKVTIIIPTKVDSNYIYDYHVDWGDGNITSGLTSNAYHI